MYKPKNISQATPIHHNRWSPKKDPNFRLVLLASPILDLLMKQNPNSTFQIQTQINKNSHESTVNQTKTQINENSHKLKERKKEKRS